MINAEYLHAIFPCRPFGPVPDENEDYQWSQIHFLFGQAMLWAQAYEDGIASFVIKAEARWKRSGKSASVIKRMTLGALQEEYQRYCYMEACHIKDMAEIRKIRNSLAHNFYRRRMDKLCTPQGRETVIAELRGAMHELQMARDDVYWYLSLLTGEPPL